jgi:hypothetical protein
MGKNCGFNVEDVLGFLLLLALARLHLWHLELDDTC